MSFKINSLPFPCKLSSKKGLYEILPSHNKMVIPHRKHSHESQDED